MPWRRGREFESRSREGLRLPAVPAHCQPLGRGRGQLQAQPPGTPARAGFPAPGRKSGPTQCCGGREGRGRGGPGIFPVGGDWGCAWNPAIGGSAGARGNSAAGRRGAAGQRLWRRLGSSAADDSRPQVGPNAGAHGVGLPLASGSWAASMLQDKKRHVVGVTQVSQT